MALRDKYDKIVCMGDSAGGNLCAALSMLLRDKQVPNVDAQVLIYPVLANSTLRDTFESAQRYGEHGYVLTTRIMHQMQELYIAKNYSLLNNPHVFPLAANSFANLPKTLLITADFDILQGEGLAYMKRMQEAKGNVEHLSIPSFHGYMSVSFNVEQIDESMKHIATFVGKL